MISMYILLPSVALTALSLRYLLHLILPGARVTDFDKKFVLITGCDSGFGKLTARRLDKMGFHVIAACHSEKGIKNLQELCSSRLICLNVDVTKSEQIQDALLKVQDVLRDRGLWALVNNAGIMSNGPIEWFHIDDFKKMADVNLWGLIEVTQVFLPLVRKAQGRVVNLGSMSGFFSTLGLAPYSVTKYGVEAFSDALRREMVPFNVKVSIIEPEAFKTPLLNGIWDEKLDALWDRLSDEKKSQYDLEEVRGKIKKMFTLGTNDKPDLVVDAVIDAVSSCDPSPRYLVGFTAKLVSLTCILPTRAQDFILSCETLVENLMQMLGVR